MKEKINYKPKKEKIETKPVSGVGYVRDLGTATYIPIEKKRREFGAHLTSIDIFKLILFL